MPLCVELRGIWSLISLVDATGGSLPDRGCCRDGSACRALYTARGVASAPEIVMVMIVAGFDVAW